MIWEQFAERDFEVFPPHRLSHNAPGMSADGFVEAQEYPFLTHNYFAVHKSRREQVRDVSRKILGIS
jgi:hypothetical protein